MDNKGFPLIYSKKWFLQKKVSLARSLLKVLLITLL